MSDVQADSITQRGQIAIQIAAENGIIAHGGSSVVAHHQIIGMMMVAMSKWEDAIRPSPQNRSALVETSNVSPAKLRDAILNAHGMATGHYIQSDTIMRQRIGNLLGMVIMADDIMRGFLGYGGPESGRDLITGTGRLEESPTDLEKPAP